MTFDIVTVIAAVVAVGVGIRLWQVLGQRNGDEPQRPNPFAAPPALTPLPVAPVYEPVPVILPPASLAGGLAQVAAIDPAFNERAFLQEARTIFTSVVEAYAGGELSGIAGLLSPALLAHFQGAVDARKAQGQTAQSRVAAITDAEVIAARAENKQAFVTVRFVSSQENILRDARGAVIGGEVGKVDEVTDVWVFARDTAVAESKWVVVETRG